ncbi:MAG: phosphoribosylanthranilate isomerase [Bacteroidales bacterium]|nr:phosphoribosylanthranilate isomerase [Bacteroidales bacterium]
MDRLLVKVCGMTDPLNVEAICACKPDLLGFIFYSRSVRYVGRHPDPAVFSIVPDAIEKVGVFVNEKYEKMLELTEKYKINTLQLHGVEAPGTCHALRSRGKTVIKVFPGNESANGQLQKDYAGSVDYFLFDTPVRSYGGSGRKFNWSELPGSLTSVPFFLSGGISPEDPDRILSLDLPSMAGVDINSRFETEPGIKSFDMVSEFLKKIRNE